METGKPSAPSLVAVTAPPVHATDARDALAVLVSAHAGADNLDVDRLPNGSCGCSNPWRLPPVWAWEETRADLTRFSQGLGEEGTGHAVIGDGLPSDSLLIVLIRALYRFLEALTVWQWVYWAFARVLAGPPGAKWKNARRGKIRRFMHNDGRWHARYVVGDLYVVGWTVAMWFVLHEARNHATDHAGAAVTAFGWTLIAIAVYRLYEIFLTQLRIVCADTFGGYEHTRVSVVRYLFFIPLYFLQVALIFAVLYLVAAPTAFLGSGNQTLMPSTFMYLSWTTITTLGSGFTPSTHGAELLVMAEVAEGWLLAGIGLSVFVGAVRLRARTPESSLEADIKALLARSERRDRSVQGAAMMPLVASGRLVATVGNVRHRVVAVSVGHRSELTFRMEGSEEPVAAADIEEFGIDPPT